MNQLAIIHICAMGIPFYCLQILQFKKDRKNQSKVAPFSNGHQNNDKGIITSGNQIKQSIVQNKVYVHHQVIMLKNQEDQNEEQNLEKNFAEDSHPKDIYSQNTHAEEQNQQKEISEGSFDSSRYFELLQKILFLVSCTVFVHGVSQSIQSYLQLEAQKVWEIIAIIIINQCFIIILYSIYKQLIEYLHSNWKNNQSIKSKRQVSMFYIFSYNIFMLFVLMPHQRLNSNPEIITELVCIALTILIFGKNIFSMNQVSDQN